MYYISYLGSQYLSLWCAEEIEDAGGQESPGDTELVSAGWRYVASPDAPVCPQKHSAFVCTAGLIIRTLLNFNHIEYLYMSGGSFRNSISQSVEMCFL